MAKVKQPPVKKESSNITASGVVPQLCNATDAISFSSTSAGSNVSCGFVKKPVIHATHNARSRLSTTTTSNVSCN